MARKIGLYGGTFDPIHVGHLAIAETVRQECGLDKVIFIPAGQPPHKIGSKVTSAIHRYNMTRIAVEDNDFFEVSPVEVERKGRTFTIDTLRILRSIYPEDHEFWFIIGGDTLLEVKSWRSASQVVKMCRLAVYMRPGYPTEECAREAEMLQSEMGADITFVKGPVMEISATGIRENIKLGKSVRYLVPIGVERYIYEHSLYKT